MRVRRVQVFISYRRSVSQSAAGRLGDALKARMGDASVFLDTGDLAAGIQWRDELLARLRAADVVLVVIGPGWAEAATDRDRERQRGGSDQDVLRLEVEYAVRDAPAVIPVLVDGATMPARQLLPRPLQPVTGLQARVLRGDSWHADVEGLGDTLLSMPVLAQRPEPEVPPRNGAGPEDPNVRRLGRYAVDGSLVVVLGTRFNHADGDRDGQPPVDDRELTRRIGAALDVDHEGRDLAWVAQQLALTDGRPALVKQLARLVAGDMEPTSVHGLLARVARALRDGGSGGLLILTANYDQALERAFDALHEPYDLVVFDGRRGRFLHVPWWNPGGPACVTIDVPNEYVKLPIDEDGRLDNTVIVKLHGGAAELGPDGERDNFVVTEDDHIGYLSSGGIENHFPLQILRKLRESNFLFLGYHVCDWANRVFLQRLWGEQRLQARSWAVEPDIDPGEEEAWDQLGVGVIARPVSEFAQSLERAVAGAEPVGR